MPFYDHASHVLYVKGPAVSVELWLLLSFSFAPHLRSEVYRFHLQCGSCYISLLLLHMYIIKGFANIYGTVSKRLYTRLKVCFHSSLWFCIVCCSCLKTISFCMLGCWFCSVVLSLSLSPYNTLLLLLVFLRFFCLSFATLVGKY